MWFVNLSTWGVWPPGLLEILVCLELFLVCKDELSNHHWPTVCAGEHFPLQTDWPPLGGDSCKMIRRRFPAASWAHIHPTLTTCTHRHTHWTCGQNHSCRWSSAGVNTGSIPLLAFVPWEQSPISFVSPPVSVRESSGVDDYSVCARTSHSGLWLALWWICSLLTPVDVCWTQTVMTGVSWLFSMR